MSVNRAAEPLSEAGVASSCGVRASTGGEITRAFVEVTKPGITRLVTLTAGVGFALVAVGPGSRSGLGLVASAIGTVVGVYLSAAGANALNQWFEQERDGVMRRTHARPLPSGRLASGAVLGWGVTLTALGVLALLALSGPVPALLSLACAGVYVLAYTPLKTRTVWNTLVGTIPGSLPPMIGAAAASGTAGIGAAWEPMGLALFALMTVWQIPHFLAIAWRYREDYARAGHRMLPSVDAGGRLTGVVMLATSLALIPASALPMVLGGGLVGPVYGVAAVATSAGVAWLSALFLRSPGDRAARTLFVATIIQLPVLLAVLVIDAGWHAFA